MDNHLFVFMHYNTHYERVWYSHCTGLSFKPNDRSFKGEREGLKKGSYGKPQTKCICPQVTFYRILMRLVHEWWANVVFHPQVHTAKPMVDTRAPRVHPHVTSKWKKQQVWHWTEEGRVEKKRLFISLFSTPRLLSSSYVWLPMKMAISCAPQSS